MKTNKKYFIFLVALISLVIIFTSCNSSHSKSTGNINYKAITCEEFGEFIIPDYEELQITENKEKDFYKITIIGINETEIEEYVNYLKANDYNVEHSEMSELSFNWLLKKDSQFVSMSYSGNSASIYISNNDLC